MVFRAVIHISQHSDCFIRKVDEAIIQNTNRKGAIVVDEPFDRHSSVRLICIQFTLGKSSHIPCSKNFLNPFHNSDFKSVFT